MTERVPASERVRLRVAFGKARRLAYLSHLELGSTIQRCVRRSGLPFVVGNGYARRMRIQFCQALPTGASSRDEYYDLQLQRRVDAGEALRLLRGATPDDLAPTAAGYVGGAEPALEAWLDHSLWEVTLSGAALPGPQELEGAVSALVARGALSFMRGDKPRQVDLPATLVSLSAAQAGLGVLRLSIVTRSTPEGSLRPGVLVAGVSEAFPEVLPAGFALTVTRAAQWHEGADGAHVKAL